MSFSVVLSKFLIAFLIHKAVFHKFYLVLLGFILEYLDPFIVGVEY